MFTRMKKHESRFTISLRPEDPRHRIVIKKLNEAGRKKADLIVSAVMEYLVRYGDESVTGITNGQAGADTYISPVIGSEPKSILPYGAIQEKDFVQSKNEEKPRKEAHAEDSVYAANETEDVSSNNQELRKNILGAIGQFQPDDD